MVVERQPREVVSIIALSSLQAGFGVPRDQVTSRCYSSKVPGAPWVPTERFLADKQVSEESRSSRSPFSGRSLELQVLEAG